MIIFKGKLFLRSTPLSLRMLLVNQWKPVFVTRNSYKDMSTNYSKTIDLLKYTEYSHTLQLEGYT